MKNYNKKYKMCTVDHKQDKQKNSIKKEVPPGNSKVFFQSTTGFDLGIRPQSCRTSECHRLKLKLLLAWSSH